MEQRFATEEAYVANPAPVQDVEGLTQAGGVYPTQIFARNLPVGEIAEVAGGVTGIRNRYVAESGTAVADETQHVPDS